MAPAALLPSSGRGAGVSCNPKSVEASAAHARAAAEAHAKAAAARIKTWRSKVDTELQRAAQRAAAATQGRPLAPSARGADDAKVACDKMRVKLSGDGGGSGGGNGGGSGGGNGGGS